MSKSKKQTKFTEGVMKELKTTEVKMKSHHYYLLLTLAMIAAGFLFVALASLALSLISYDDQLSRDLRYIGAPSEADRFGPMILDMAILVAGTVGAIFVVKKFKVGYKNRTVVVASIVLAGVVVSALIAVQTGLASDISRQKPLHPFAPISKDAYENHRQGVVEEVEEDSIWITSRRHTEKVKVTISKSTTVHSRDEIKPGDTVFVKGEWKDNEFEAELIKVNPPKKVLKGHGSEINSSHSL